MQETLTKEIINLAIDKLKHACYPMYVNKHVKKLMSKKLIKCPECNSHDDPRHNGYLEIMTQEEKDKIKSSFLSEKVLGCDECQFLDRRRIAMIS